MAACVSLSIIARTTKKEIRTKKQKIGRGRERDGERKKEVENSVTHRSAGKLCGIAKTNNRFP